MTWELRGCIIQDECANRTSRKNCTTTIPLSVMCANIPQVINERVIMSDELICWIT